MDGKVKPAHSSFPYLSPSFKITLLSIVVMAGLFALYPFELSRYFPIKTVRVYGLSRIDQHDIEGMLLPLVKRSFFTVNVEYIRDQLLQIPWVSDTFVRVHWPDWVEITVIEKEPVARWNDQTLLSMAGELFSPKRETYPTDLPRFVGPVGKQITMMHYYQEMNRLLTPIHAKITYFEMTPYSTWKLKLDNGVSMQMGYKDVLTRFSHFVKVYPKIVGNRANDVEYVDLRYSNGMAVRWKTTVKA